MYVENIVDMSLQGTEICHVMSKKYMGWLNVQLKNLWEKFPNWRGFICNVYLFNFKVKVNLKFWQINLKHFCENFHIIGEIDGSHISIRAPIIGGEDYYYL